MPPNSKEIELQAKTLPETGKELRNTITRLRRQKLKEYQSQWLRKKRDQTILERGHEQQGKVIQGVLAKTQSLIMPEMARISEAMSSNKELNFSQKLDLVEDIGVLCTRDSSVVYLPGERPIEHHCPVNGCYINSERSQHIHQCVRRERATLLNVPENEMRFCYECMECQHCDAVMYRHTLIRPAYCPFCLANHGKEADERLKYWLYRAAFMRHIESCHLSSIKFPTTKHYCGCPEQFTSEKELRYHLHDMHGLNDAIWKRHNGFVKRNIFHSFLRVQE
ncbi:hypothetical protein BO71DRAFT_447557 [Aspergillus ellipticus CBS 707.79]|uniref:Uncharacterized protein n=1 Tax=Aspergillus ellipticus CBS 707.79 TaxID=1448320 RepID=A0A319DKH3_9EURO|nr:hypothetical protein BO71DRAFT_447557 [Aspergillus ellipticus CBS 707.79]